VPHVPAAARLDALADLPSLPYRGRALSSDSLKKLSAVTLSMALPSRTSSSAPSTLSPSRSGSSRRRSGGYRPKRATCVGITSNSSVGTRNWRRWWRRIRITPLGRPLPTRRGRSGRGACGGLQAGGQAGRPGTMGRRSDFPRAQTASSSTARASAGTATRRSTRLSP
jgi:hypothetical protein